MPSSTLERNLRRVRERIERAARRAGRDAAEVRLLPVTKSVAVGLALELARLGERELAENRLEGLEPKAAHFEREGELARWHFVGHVQRNKARRVLRRAAVVHSVDSVRLLETLERIAAEEGRRPEVYLEVKLSGEEAKHGLAPAELEAAVRRAGDCRHLTLVGLMTMAPLPPAVPSRKGPAEEGGSNAPAARAVFETLARLARGLEADPELSNAFRDRRVLLSMGMSEDLEEAVAAGSHVVRIGTALFEGLGHEGERTRSEVAG